MIVLNSLFPIFSLLLLGWCLKKWQMTNGEFLKKVDSLIYYIFFPIMLFWKIGSSSTSEAMDLNFFGASLCTILTMFFISTSVIKIVHIPKFQAGSFSQCCYRFNTYIGVAVILNGLGEEGLRLFGILIGFTIPLLNVFAVSILIWNSGKKVSVGKRIGIASSALVSNPLILACIAGIFYSHFIGTFPVFIDNSLRLTSMVALPMALISIGGSLTFSGIKGNFNLSVLAAFLKLLVLPLLGYGYFYIFDVQGLPFLVGMIFLALPTSTASYVLSAQLNSDTDLASSAIVISTLLSFLSLSAVLLFQ